MSEFIIKTTVLVCDDDKSHLFIMQQMLESNDYIVELAEDGMIALERFRLNIPDIILLDVNMPNLDGFGVCEAIRNQSHGKDIPILMITGADDHESIAKAFECGATDFLAKPINWSMIPHRIKYMLKNRDNLLSLKNSQERLKNLAYFDSLTGLPNRQLFEEKSTSLFEISKRTNTFFAVAIFNLDNFKRINECLGYIKGDELIQHIANKFSANVRKYDVVTRNQTLDLSKNIARIGGDEFSLVMPNLKTEFDAINLCRRIAHSIATPIKLKDYEVVITASVGIAVFPSSGKDLNLLMKNADIALHNARAKGPGNYEVYEHDNRIRVDNPLKFEQCMRNALKTKEFEIYFQPKVGIHSGIINGSEALLRWDSKELGTIPPTEFIPIAEENGLIIELGDFVLNKVCESLQIINKTLQHKKTSISVNVSGQQFCQDDYIDRVKRIIANSSIDPCQITLEITESFMMDKVQASIEKLKDLKILGVKLSIDDFGTGYSSLSYLKSFPVDELKIDRSFIINIAKDQKDVGIVRSVLGLANSLSLETVVEGVETHQQIEKLTELSTEQEINIQGYYFYKPMPFDDFLSVINQPSSLVRFLIK